MANRIVRSRSPFAGSRRGERRKTVWFTGPATTTVIAAAGTAVMTHSLGAAALAYRPFTIVRTRGYWFVESDQSAASEVFNGNMGMAVVSDQASAVGVAAVPTPATDRDSDMFFVKEDWIGRFQLVGTAIAADTSGRVYDSKAMRKVEDGQDVVVTIEAGLINSGCIIHHVFRQLIKTN